MEIQERLQKRIAELAEAEIATAKQLTAIRTVLAEMRALLEPAPVISGDPLGELA
jgi:hypothetical protein